MTNQFPVLPERKRDCSDFREKWACGEVRDKNRNERGSSCERRNSLQKVRVERVKNTSCQTSRLRKVRIEATTRSRTIRRAFCAHRESRFTSQIHRADCRIVWVVASPCYVWGKRKVPLSKRPMALAQNQQNLPESSKMQCFGKEARVSRLLMKWTLLGTSRNLLRNGKRNNTNGTEVLLICLVHILCFSIFSLCLTVFQVCYRFILKINNTKGSRVTECFNVLASHHHSLGCKISTPNVVLFLST